MKICPFMSRPMNTVLAEPMSRVIAGKMIPVFSTTEIIRAECQGSQCATWVAAIGSRGHCGMVVGTGAVIAAATFKDPVIVRDQLRAAREAKERGIRDNSN